jgi:excisionase family DNA binding protein
MTEQQNALTPRQAAKYLGISDGALRLWRSRGEGPRYFRAGGKLVRYRRSDLDAWIDTRLSTALTSGNQSRPGAAK